MSSFSSFWMAVLLMVLCVLVPTQAAGPFQNGRTVLELNWNNSFAFPAGSTPNYIITSDYYTLYTSVNNTIARYDAYTGYQHWSVSLADSVPTSRNISVTLPTCFLDSSVDNVLIVACGRFIFILRAFDGSVLQRTTVLQPGPVPNAPESTLTNLLVDDNDDTVIVSSPTAVYIYLLDRASNRLLGPTQIGPACPATICNTAASANTTFTAVNLYMRDATTLSSQFFFVATGIQNNNVNAVSNVVARIDLTGIVTYAQIIPGVIAKDTVIYGPGSVTARKRFYLPFYITTPTGNSTINMFRFDDDVGFGPDVTWNTIPATLLPPNVVYPLQDIPCTVQTVCTPQTDVVYTSVVYGNNYTVFNATSGSLMEMMIVPQELTNSTIVLDSFSDIYLVALAPISAHGGRQDTQRVNIALLQYSSIDWMQSYYQEAAASHGVVSLDTATFPNINGVFTAFLQPDNDGSARGNLFIFFSTQLTKDTLGASLFSFQGVDQPTCSELSSNDCKVCEQISGRTVARQCAYCQTSSKCLGFIYKNYIPSSAYNESCHVPKNDNPFTNPVLDPNYQCTPNHTIPLPGLNLAIAGVILFIVLVLLIGQCRSAAAGAQTAVDITGGHGSKAGGANYAAM